jgi:RNA polymerase sigma-70 factor (ECF subfamily)
VSSTPPSEAGVPADSSAVAERYRAPIYRYVLGLVGNASLADDLTQETFLRVHQHLGELKDAAALEGWLYRIATNLCYDRFRHRELGGPSLPVLTPEEGRNDAACESGALRPDHFVEQQEMSDCVLRFLSALAPTYRQVLILHDLQGYTDPEIAQMLGLSLQNVKIRLHRARARLRAALGEGCQFSRDDRGVFICEPRHR